MDADSDVEIISTSDVGEREEMAAALAEYWDSPPPPAERKGAVRDASPDPLDVLDAQLDGQLPENTAPDAQGALNDDVDMEDDEPVSFGQADDYYSPLEFPDSSPEPDTQQDPAQSGGIVDDLNVEQYASKPSDGDDDMVLGTPLVQSSTLGNDDGNAEGLQRQVADDMVWHTPPRRRSPSQDIDANFHSQEALRDVEDILNEPNSQSPPSRSVVLEVGDIHPPDRNQPSSGIDAIRTPSRGQVSLGLFTPIRNSPLPDTAISPLTPLNDQDRFFSPSQRPTTPSPALPPAREPSAPPEIPPETRYSLRHRQAKQLRPYEYDKKVYKHQMRGNPDAIVKLRSPGGTERSVRQSETQEGDPDYEAPPEPVHRERPAKARREEDEDDSWLRPYKHLLEQQENEERQTKKRRKTDHPRPFPLAPHPEEHANKRRERPEPPEQHANDADEEDEDEESPVLKRPSTSTARVVRSESPFDEFFGDHPAPQSPEPVVISSSPTQVPMDVDPDLGIVTSPTAAEDEPGPVDGDDDEEQEEQEEEEEEEVDERTRRMMRKKKKALRHMLPRFVTKQLEGDSSSSSSGDDNKENERVRPAKPTQRRRSPSPEAPLLPGRGRTKINPDAVHEPLVLRGDPESESDDEDESSESDDGVGGAGGLTRRRRDENEDDDAIVISSGSEAMEVLPARYLGGGGSGRVREGDLIDHGVGGRGGAGGGGGGGGGGSGRHGIEVVTSQDSDSDGAKSQPRRKPLEVMTLQGQLGHGQQATLGGASATGDPPRKNKLPPGIWVVQGNRKPSPRPARRRHRVVHVQQHQQADFFAALAPSSNPASAAATKPKSKAKPAQRHVAHGRAPAGDNPLVNALENVSPPRKSAVEEGARPLRLRRAATPEHERTALRLELSLNFDIPCVPAGLKFAETTYIGKGKLFELCTLISNPSTALIPPVICFFRQLELNPGLSFDAFCQLLPTALDAVRNWIVSLAHDDLQDNTNDAQVVYYFIARYFSCCARPEALYATLAEQVGAFTMRLEDSMPGETTPQLLDALWFGVEIMARVCYLPALRSDPNHVAANFQQLRGSITQLMARLLDFGLEETMLPIQTAKNAEEADAAFQATDSAEKALECWVCLINLVRKAPPEPDCSLGSFWDVLRDRLVDAAEGKNSYESSELMWCAIFSVCAIAQFTEHGFSTTNHRTEYGWQVVLCALKRIRLAADEKTTTNLQILRRRDRIIRLVVRRCFVLCVQWKWKLHDAYQLFNELARIFRSRNYGDLLCDISDFPGFINKHDVGLLKNYEFKNDTAFAIFLKLTVLASEHLDEANIDKTKALRRIISLVTPMSSPTFTKASPPTGQQLSMLFNRISVVVVGFFVEPTEANARKCVAKVKTFVNFSTADVASRKAIIRAMMHLAIMHRHFNFPLDVIRKWFAETTTVLLDEWRALDLSAKSKPGASSATGVDVKVERQDVSLCMWLVLGALRTIMQTPNMTPTIPATPSYPDPEFLNGPWISDVLTSSFKDDRLTCDELRKFLHAFLDARRAFMPASARPSMKSENVESQEADDFEFEDEDQEEEFALGCGERDEPSPGYAHRKRLDTRTCEIIQKNVEPVLFDLICTRHGPEAKQGDSLDTREQHDVDLEWIDCWTGCLHVLVKNQHQAMSWRLLIEGSIWGRIIDSRWRRRVRQRFMFVVLKLHPMTYKRLCDHFVDAFIQSLVNVQITWEHEFAALLFSIDGLRHPLLATVSAQRPSPEADFEIDDTELTQSRPKFLEAIIARVAEFVAAVAAPGEGDLALKRRSSQFVTTIVDMLHALRDLENEEPRGPEYLAFCRAVRQFVKSHPVLLQNGRVAEAI
ncbi:hypothetical protein AURDEDRAFT_185329 [Auricularia subglabra TFB-10046 SS5]|nr:hypothetical protein AURDEDRAFT_185329 [Auricularia subglabra TFB-10046 SS5]